MTKNATKMQKKLLISCKASTETSQRKIAYEWNYGEWSRIWAKRRAWAEGSVRKPLWSLGSDAQEVAGEGVQKGRWEDGCCKDLNERAVIAIHWANQSIRFGLDSGSKIEEGQNTAKSGAIRKRALVLLLFPWEMKRV